MASHTPIDPFTSRRLVNFITDFRKNSGQLPTLQDLDAAGFSGETVKAGVRAKLISEFYVTLTNGTVMKGYKLADPS